MSEPGIKSKMPDARLLSCFVVGGVGDESVAYDKNIAIGDRYVGDDDACRRIVSDDEDARRLRGFISPGIPQEQGRDTRTLLIKESWAPLAVVTRLPDSSEGE